MLSLFDINIDSCSVKSVDKNKTNIENHIIPDNMKSIDERIEILLGMESYNIKAINSFDDIININFVGLEAEDPFADMNEESDFSSADDTANVDDESMQQDIGGEDPFADLGEGGDWSEGGDNTEGGSKPKKEEISRKEAIKEVYNVSKNIRKILPKNFRVLKLQINACIKVLDYTNVKEEHAKFIDLLITRYRVLEKLIDDYLGIIDTEMYEDILTKYISFYTIMVKLKSIYKKIVESDEKEINLFDSVEADIQKYELENNK